MAEDKKSNPNRDVFHDRSIIALLEKLGLSRNEVKCYLASLTVGAAPISEIAKSAHINRVNAYGAIKALTGRGLVEQEITKQGRKVHAAPLDTLKSLAQEHQKSATKLRWRIEDLLPALSALSSQIDERAQLLLFEGEQTILTMLERTLRIPQPGSELLEMCLFVEEDVVATSKYSKESYVPERVQRNCFKKLLCLKNDRHIELISHDKEELRETRFLPKPYEEGIDMCNVNIYADEVALYWHAQQPMGVVIQSKKIANVLRVLFNMAWEVAEKSKAVRGEKKKP